MTAAIRVCIVDDHPVVRDGLRGMLNGLDRIEVVGEAADGADALLAVARWQPDVVLMDLRMPRLDGVSATAQLTTQQPATRVLVLTTYNTDADIQRALDAGASGYLLKDADRDELVRAIEHVAAGHVALAPTVASRVLDHLRGADGDALTDREIEVLDHVAAGRSNRATARALAISEATVKSHLLHIYRKLGVEDRTSAVTSALQRGIIRLD